MEKKDISKTFLSDKPIKMFPIPQYNKAIIGKDNRFEYIIVPISKEEDEYIRQGFLKEDGVFTLRTGDYVVGSEDMILFGKPFENTVKVERKLDTIMSNQQPLVVRTPLDEKNLKIGNKLNTGATPITAFRYHVCTIGRPEYILLFKNVRRN